MQEHRIAYPPQPKEIDGEMYYCIANVCTVCGNVFDPDRHVKELLKRARERKNKNCLDKEE